MKFVPKGPINNNPALIQIMAWRPPGDKPLSEPMMVRLLTHMCVTRPEWVNTSSDSPLYVVDLNIAITVAADGLAPDGARPSAGTVLTTKLDMFSSMSMSLPVIQCLFYAADYMSQNSLRDLPKHDYIIKWRHFLSYWPFVRGIHWSLVDSPHEGQWCSALMFSLICTWTNGWANNPDTGDLRNHHTHYDIAVIVWR